MYKKQANLSHRTSQSMLLQQYSTPAPISYLAGLHILSENESAIYFEPSAGNGLLTVALPEKNTYVNEIDDIRLRNLKTQPFGLITTQDATLPFPDYYKKFDGVITNPPFGTVPDAIDYDGFKIKSLEQIMALRVLDCMKDKGKASIIIGGHTTWDEKGRIQGGKNRLFFNYLYKHYKVNDVILISGSMYSRQGTSFPVRLILIDGRKEIPEGVAPLKDDYSAKVVEDFDELWERVFFEEIPKSQTNKEKLPKFKPGEIVYFFKEGGKIGKGEILETANYPSGFWYDLKTGAISRRVAEHWLHKTENEAKKYYRIRIAKVKAEAKLKLLIISKI